MNDPPRLLDPKSGAPVSRSLLRAGVDMGPPPGAKEQVWSSLSTAIGVAGVGAAVTSLGPSSLGSSSLGSSSLGSASAGSAGSAAGAPVPSVATPSGAAAKASGVKLVAGKWILLSSLSIVIAGGAAYRAMAGRASAEAAPVASAQAAKEANATAPEVPIANDPISAKGPRAADAMNAGAASTADAAAPRDMRAMPPVDHRPVAMPEVASERAGAKDLNGPKSPTEASSSTPGASADGASSLLEESAALAGARSKLQANDAAGAIRALGDMDKRFGGGGLSQERTALLIQALAANGQRDAAAKYADAFLAAYPSSPLSARVRPFATP